MGSMRRLLLVGLVGLSSISPLACSKSAQSHCGVVLTDSGHASYSELVEVGGQIPTYSAVNHSWSTVEGKVFGYSIEEDSIIYETLKCARTSALYER